VNVLVDTSVWSLALRRRSSDLREAENSVKVELSDLVKEGRARIIGLVRQELLSGIQSVAQYEKLRRTLRSFPDEHIDTADYEAAAKAGNDCRAKGIAVSVIDMLLCSVATVRGWTVFTADSDFKRYAAVLPVKLHTPRR
jgi:hypothetical protein